MEKPSEKAGGGQSEGSRAVRAVDGLTLDLEFGEIFVLLGQNGAGKTTLIQLLTGTLEADAGIVTCFGGQHLIDKGEMAGSLSSDEKKKRREEVQDIRRQMGVCP